MIKVVEEFKGSKPLPKDESGLILNVFHANGTKYYILQESDSFPISRWEVYSRLTSQFLSGMDFNSMYGTLDKIEKMCSSLVTDKSVSFTDIIISLRAAKDNTRALSSARFDSALYLATLFVLAEGEDITTWSIAQADEKLTNWAMEGYGVADFFALAAHYCAAYHTQLQSTAAKIVGEMLNTGSTANTDSKEEE